MNIIFTTDPAFEFGGWEYTVPATEPNRCCECTLGNCHDCCCFDGEECQWALGDGADCD